MRLLSDLLGTLSSTFRFNRATLSAAGLTAARVYTLPDLAGTLDLKPLRAALAAVFTGAASNTTNQTVLTLNVPANTLVAGKMYRVSLFGTQSQSAAANTVTARLQVGATAMVAVAVAAGNVAQTNRALYFNADLMFPVVGATGSMVAGGELAISGVLPLGNATVTPSAINTTAIVTITVTLANSLSDAANICRAVTCEITEI